MADPIRTVDVWVPGRPAAQGSKRHVGHGRMIESSKAIGPWRTLVAWHLAQVHTGPPLDGPIVVTVQFVMPRPVGTPKRHTPAATKRPDVDKLLRGVFDAVTGVVWRDDAQVVEVTAVKRLAQLDEQPGAAIRISALGARDTA